MSPRVLIAGLFHETHTFLDEVTRIDDFQITRGADLLTREGDGSPLGGALAEGSRFGWKWIPTVDYRAQPSGTVADDVFEQFWRDFRDCAKEPIREGVDAIFLVLHGAMVTPSHPDAEGEFLSRLRRLPHAAGLPIFGVFDLHANFTPRMAELSDCLVAYRMNPHADACTMGSHAAELLQEWFQRQRDKAHRPKTSWQRAGVVWPPMGTCTDDSPMRDLEALGRQLEADHPEILAVNICAGFSHADTYDTGVSFTVVEGTERFDDSPGKGFDGTSTRILRELVALATNLRRAGDIIDEPVSTVIGKLRDASPGLTVIAEPSDNIGGGAPGDGTGLLRAFVEHDLQRCAICLCDPRAVREIELVPIGGSLRLALGGRGSRMDPGPYSLEVNVVSRSDGRFRLEDPQSHLASMFGHEFDMGRCSVVQHRGVMILLTSRKTPPFDLGQWRSQGIEPAQMSVIGVKAAVAHRRVYRPIAERLWTADTPGPCRSDVRTFTYKNIRRPIFPLDV